MTDTEIIKILTEVLKAVNKNIKEKLDCPSFICRITEKLFGKYKKGLIQKMLKYDGIACDGSGFSQNHPIWADVRVFVFPITHVDKNRRRACWLEYRINLITRHKTCNRV